MKDLAEYWANSFDLKVRLCEIEEFSSFINEILVYEVIDQFIKINPLNL
jgi:hypothetical protein